MSPLWFISGLLVGLLAGGAAWVIGTQKVIEAALQHVAVTAAWLFSLAVVGVVVFFIARAQVIRRLNLIKSLSLGEIFEATHTLLTNPKELSREAWLAETRRIGKSAITWYASVTAYYRLINIIVALFVAFTGGVASYFVWQQNQLIAAQTEIISRQEKLLEGQTTSNVISTLTDIAGVPESLQAQLLEITKSLENVDPERNIRRAEDPKLVSMLQRVSGHLRPSYSFDIVMPENGRLNEEFADSVRYNLLSLGRGQLGAGLLLGRLHVDDIDLSYADMRFFSNPVHRDFVGSCADAAEYGFDIAAYRNASFESASLYAVKANLSDHRWGWGSADIARSDLKWGYDELRGDLDLNPLLWDESTLDMVYSSAIRDSQYSVDDLQLRPPQLITDSRLEFNAYSYPTLILEYSDGFNYTDCIHFDVSALVAQVDPLSMIVNTTENQPEIGEYLLKSLVRNTMCYLRIDLPISSSSQGDKTDLDARAKSALDRVFALDMRTFEPSVDFSYQIHRFNGMPRMTLSFCESNETDLP